MSRLTLLAACALAGLLLGMGALLALQSGTAPERPGPGPTTAPTEPAAAPQPKPAAVPEPDLGLLLAWTSGGLLDGFAEQVARIPRVDSVTAVAGDLLELVTVTDADGRVVEQHDDGWVVPLDAVAVDLDTYPAFAPKSAQPALDALGPGGAVLSETGAALRGIGPGGTLTLADGTELSVTGVVDDEVAGGAEVVIAAGSDVVTTSRYVLLTYRGERAAVEESIRAIDQSVAVRIRGPGESPFLRHGDAVLPQAQIKDRFGEFAYRRTSGRDLEQDRAFVAEHIVTQQVPILGSVRCHRSMVEALRGALAELAERNLEHTIDPAGYAGCHTARLTTSQASVSRHAWGVALDVNVGDNPVGQAGAQDPRLVEVMERWGLAWGGEWLVPDPAHFEFLRPPR